MTEGLLVQHDKPMCVRIWLEVGHVCEPRRSALGRALALDWRLWVRGASGRDISGFVHKVVFHLRPASAFVYPKRVRVNLCEKITLTVLQEPPYEIQESGNVSIDIPIHVYLKYSSEPKKICLNYSLEIENQTKSSSESRRVYYDLENPPEQLCQALMKGGGEVVPRARSGRRRARSPAPTRRERAEPPCRHSQRKLKPYALDDICAKCGESTHADFRKQLRSIAMTEDEVARVSQLYLAYTNYEKSPEALPLPPLSDPIYRMPEVPLSLREALKSVEVDFY